MITLLLLFHCSCKAGPRFKCGKHYRNLCCVISVQGSQAVG